MNFRRAVREKSIDTQRLDDRSLRVWARKGLTFEKLRQLDDVNGQQTRDQKKQHYLTENIPHITSMLQNNFPVERLGQLDTSIHPALYAHGWLHGIDPSDIMKARNVGYSTPEDVERLEPRKQQAAKDARKLYPYEKDQMDNTYTPGNLPDYISARIGGATHEEVMDAARTLHPYRLVNEHNTYNSEESESRPHSPLDLYSRIRNAGGTHEDFKGIMGAIKKNHDASMAPQEHKINSLKGVLENYTSHRESGKSHKEAANNTANSMEVDKSTKLLTPKAPEIKSENKDELPSFEDLL